MKHLEITQLTRVGAKIEGNQVHHGPVFCDGEKFKTLRTMAIEEAAQDNAPSHSVKAHILRPFRALIAALQPSKMRSETTIDAVKGTNTLPTT